ncbi:hypothetical protein, partial [Pseudofulvimonas gallinarii]|uniref:hypothetical protein n=1 Tax=Pseudofulvimonas gallinarii TaxID=634155 RepID=UPI00198231BF
ALLRVHGIESSPALVERVIECPFRLQQNLYCARSRGNLTQLALLDRPVLLIRRRTRATSDWYSPGWMPTRRPWLVHSRRWSRADSSSPCGPANTCRC